MEVAIEMEAMAEVVMVEVGLGREAVEMAVVVAMAAVATVAQGMAAAPFRLVHLVPPPVGLPLTLTQALILIFSLRLSFTRTLGTTQTHLGHQQQQHVGHLPAGHHLGLHASREPASWP